MIRDYPCIPLVLKAPPSCLPSAEQPSAAGTDNGHPAGRPQGAGANPGWARLHLREQFSHHHDQVRAPSVPQRAPASCFPHQEVLPMSLTCCPFYSLLWKGHPVTVRQLKAPETHPDVLLADLQHCRLPVPAGLQLQGMCCATVVVRLWLEASTEPPNCRAVLDLCGLVV